MKKILIVSTVSRQFYLFEQGNIEVLKSLGYEVHAAANFIDANERLDELDIIRHPFDIQRSPLSLKNFKAFIQLKKIMKSEDFDVVHCHSPMGGVLTRLVGRSIKFSPIIYTAHGFHFYKGAPLINWLLYYPIEKFLSRFTDVLITINKEDYSRAKKFKAKNVIYVPGIGVDTKKFSSITINKNKKRKELGVSEDTILILSIGELIKRKNHETALKAIAKLKYRDFIYIICGQGELKSYLMDLAKSLGIEKNVKFLGYRNDISEICVASDIFLFPSFQEGLPVSVMEAMASGLPVISSNIRGNSDLIDNEKGGFLVEPEDTNGFTRTIKLLIEDRELRKKMGEYNSKKVEKYDKQNTKKIMLEIYKDI